MTGVAVAGGTQATSEAEIIYQLTHLVIISTQFVAGLIALAALCCGLVVAGWVRSPRRVARNTAGTLAALVLVVAAAADGVNAYYGYLPTLTDVSSAMTGDRNWISMPRAATLSGSRWQRAASAGAVARLVVPADPADGFARTTAVAYLPPQYFIDPAARFPIVYLLHGSPGKPADWYHGGRAAATGLALARADQPAVLVAPQLSRSWTDDPECVDGRREKVESHLFGVAMPALESQLPVRRDRGDRIFAGLSAGGYCALNLALRHWQSVGTVVDLSGDTVPTHSGGLRALFGAGPTSQALAAQNSPPDYLPQLPSQIRMRVWLDTGDEDHKILREMSGIAPQLRHHGIAVHLDIRDGGHTFHVWVPALRQALDWALTAPQSTA